MGGITDYGATFDTKTSPRRATIERVQAELRLEYDVREERKRELEFLEKGGNPLDYKFSLAASISLQSTSLTAKQLAEPHFTSEVKGSFVLAASPHGDSVESSGRPGVPVNREAYIADNILLSDHENILLDIQKRAKPTGKRDSVSHLEQTSDFDNSQNVKELEDSLSFRHGAQGQAYARRNRSRTIRNSSLPSTDIRHENRVSTLSSTRQSPTGTKECLSEGQVEVGADSSNSNSKAASPNLNAKSKDSDDQVNMDLDPLQNSVATTETKVRVSDWPRQVDSTNNLQQFDPDVISIDPEKVSDGITLQSGQDVVKEPVSVDVMSIPLEFSTKNIDLVGEEVNGTNALDISMTDKVYENISEKPCKTSTMHSTMGSIIPSKEEKSCGEMSTLLVKSNGNTDWASDKKLAGERTSSLLYENDAKEKDHLITINKKITLDEPSSCILIKKEVPESKIITEYDGAPTANKINTKLNSEITDEPQIKAENSMGVSNSTKEAVGMKNAGALPICETSVVEKKSSNSATELLNPSEELTKKAQEDAILKEACMIEAKLKGTGDLSSCNKLSNKRLKCHWDFVLEEMAWMANDFMQEHLWKITAAAQVSRLISSSGHSNFEHMNLRNKQKNIARTMAKAIMGFWHAAEVFSCNHTTLEEDDRGCNSDKLVSWNLKQSEFQKLEVKDRCMSDSDHSGNALTLRIQNYAVRFLKFSSCPSKYSTLAEAPNTPDRQNDPGILDMSWEEQDPQEKLFYTVPPGAMLAYRDYIESQCVQDKKMGHMVYQEECETSLCDSVADGNRDNAYEEDDGDTDTYCFPVASDISSKFGHKKKKHLVQKSYAPRLYETSTNLSHEPCVESKLGNTPFTINGKRPSLLNVGSIPTKRVRSAARQRVMSPFTPGVNTSIQVSSKTDVSSGETSSLQDDQSSLYGGSQPRKSLEVESTVDFERQLTYDGNEASTKVKKKKKPKHFGYKNSLNLTNTGLLTVPGKGPSFESRFHVDSMSQHDQKDHVKKRTETQNLDSNGTSVSYGQHPAKKPKLLKQLQEISPEAPNPVTGSMPSPAASQMSNMSNSNKPLKIISRDRGRKPKALKLAVGQSGSGSPWLNYEDQALIVLVHDLGANWELVSDAINGILLFKHRFFRTPKECKERHKVLLDKNAGDGADSAEDSGSSQPYPSTLPRIPKGSARQLLQRLQGPMEEDILKRHFEKIISLVRQLHSCRHRNANQESKRIIPAHSSHVIAISQACPGHIKGGILTPLDLCDANTTSPDAFPLVYQGAHSSGLLMPSHHGSMAPVLPATGVNTMLPGSPGLVLSSSLSSPAVSLNPSPRDTQRFGASRPSSLSVDDTKRVHQYSQMLSGRGLQQSNMPMNGPLQTGGNGVQVFPSSNGGGMSGVNRSMPGQRSGFPGMSSNMLNMVSTGNLLSSGGQGTQNSVNIHPGVASGPGNSMLRPRGPLHMLRAGENTEENKQMMREHQVHASQGNGQAISTFNGVNAAFPSMPVPPSIQTFSVQQHQQSHTAQQPHMLGKPQHSHMQSSAQTNSQQQAYAIQRQLQLRNQPQAPFPGSSVVPPVQGNSQIQVPVLPSPVTPVASSPGQSKQQNVARNLHSTTQNPIVKQKQRQQIEQQQQRQQPHQQGKLIKGIGRPNILMNQNMTVDTSQDTGFSTAPKTQASERPIVQQGQSLFHNNSGLSQNLSQAATQAKMYRQMSQSSKQITSAGDSSNQGSSPSNMPSYQQAHIPTSVPLPSQNQQQQHQRHIMNQAPQNIRMLQQNRQNNADGRAQCSTDQVQGNQMIASTSATHCTDSSISSAIASVNQWKPDPLSEANPPTANLAKLMPEDSVANDISAASSRGSVARQFSGNVSTPGHNVEGQWMPQPQQQLRPKSQH